MVTSLFTFWLISIRLCLEKASSLYKMTSEVLTACKKIILSEILTYFCNI